MSIILEQKEIPYNKDLTIDALEKHANGYLRYQNFSDLVTQGPEAVQAYIERANRLFKRNLQKEFPDEADRISDLDLSYMTVFFRDKKETPNQALPMTDFLKFRFDDNGTEKSGFGVFFSSYGRELDRGKLESGQPLENIDASAAVYNLMFKDKFPDIGVLDGYPIMTMRQAKNGNDNDLLHQYYSLLGTHLEVVQPDDCPGNLRCYHHGEWQDIDPKVRIAAVSLGQAMQEFIRTDEYRTRGNPETDALPIFDWGKHGQVKGEQAKLSKRWFEEHADGIKELIERSKEQDAASKKPDTIGDITAGERATTESVKRKK